MGGVAEAWGGAVGVFESAVDRFGGAVVGAGPVEERGVSSRRLVRVRPSLQASTGLVGTVVLIESMRRVMVFLPSVRLVARQAAIMVW